MKSVRRRVPRGASENDPHSVVSGRARVDRRTKDLIPRLEPGEVAVIDHLDVDRVAGEGLVDAAPVAVLNAAASSSGRYPNAGPLLLLEAGIVLVDGLGSEIMDAIAEDDEVVVDGDRVLVEGQVVATGIRQSLESIAAIHDSSRDRLGDELVRFVKNTVQHVESNRDLLDDSIRFPDLGIDWEGRHVLIVVRGHDYKNDLDLLRRSAYLRENRPILVAVDGGADALLEIGYEPDVIVGDMDSVSETALRCGAPLAVHAYPDGRAPGAVRLDELGLSYTIIAASGTSEDIAMVMAFEMGAELIVAVGTHSSMVDFLDKGRSGMASTMLVRMKVGPILVDAKGVSRLYRGRVRKRDLLLLVAAALLAMGVIVFISEPIRLFIRLNWVLLSGFVTAVNGLVGGLPT